LSEGAATLTRLGIGCSELIGATASARIVTPTTYC
jgi:hypothetical protein